MNRWGEAPLAPRGWPLNRRVDWLSVKEIDGLPGEWTYNVMCRRDSRFHLQELYYIYYEPVWRPDLLVHCAWLSHALITTFRGTIAGVDVAFEAYESIFDAPEGNIPMPTESERFVGSHNVRLTGWDLNANLFRFDNSWGPEWGDRGRGTMSRQYVEEYGWDAWFGWDLHHGPPSAVIDKIFDVLAAGGERIPTYDIRRLWSTRIPQGRDSAAGPEGRYDVRWFRHASVTGRCEVDVIEARLNSILVGWCMALEARHRESDEHALLVFELFVWPPYRQAGVAHCMIESLLRFAQGWRASKVEVLVHAVDLPALDLAHLEAKGWTWTLGGDNWPPVRGSLSRQLTDLR